MHHVSLFLIFTDLKSNNLILAQTAFIKARCQPYVLPISGSSINRFNNTMILIYGSSSSTPSLVYYFRWQYAQLNFAVLVF